METQLTHSNCRSCSRQTKHDLLYEVSHGAGDDFFNENHTWQVLRCRGCETVGFRYRIQDFDIMEEGPDGEDQPTVTWHRYPNAIVGHRELEYLHVAPRVIQQIYRQSVTAYAGEAYILAGIGLRATIEAVCNHLEISGNSLERRIDQLFKGGYISNSDKGRLHAIRFLGNDAAHEIKQPKRSDLRVALEIVEHLINSVFILEHRANGLDVLVDTYEKFVALLKKCASEFDSDKPATLAALLGRHKRRAGNELASFEKRVSEEIESGALTFLAVDSTQQLDDKAVQLYKVDKEKLKGESDNEIPF